MPRFFERRVRIGTGGYINIIICQICRDAIKTESIEHAPCGPLQDTRSDHHNTVQSFQESVNAGCFICKYAFRNAESGLKDEIEELLQSERPEVKKLYFSKLNVVAHRIDGLLTLHIRLLCNPEVLFNLGPISKFTLFEYDTRERDELLGKIDRRCAQISLARLWYDVCCRHHGCGWPMRQSSFIPTRLVEIQRNVSQQRICWRVLDTSKAYNPLMINYGTVSHRWSKEINLRLTEGTLTQFINFQSTVGLSSNFRTALDVAAELSLAYIWIDSLCIIQDSKSDWARESVRMKDVYSHSCLNIALDLRRGSCLDRGRLLDQPICHLDWIKSHQTQDLDQADQSKPSVFHLHALDLMEHSIDTSELNQRGWIYQERIFSQRTLHIHEDQMFWECGHTRACEMFPEGIPLMLHWPASFCDDRDPRYRFEPFKRSFRDPRSDNDAILRLWTMAVEQYSSMDLTFGGDKIIAFAGIAKYLNSLNPDKYYAGIFRQFLPHQLLWTKDKLDGMDLTRPSVYRAPSWSWAAIDGPVTTFDRIRFSDLSDMIDIKEVSISPVTEDYFGQIKDGHLIVSGWLMQVSVVDDVPTMRSGAYDSVFKIRLTSLELAERLDVDGEGDNRTILFLPVLLGEESGSHARVVQGLLLSPVTTKYPLRLVRVGFLERYATAFEESMVPEELSAYGLYRSPEGDLYWEPPATPRQDITIV